jgi:uracil-DNA glycosylase
MTFTDDVISLINKVDRPIVYLLWGKYAQSKAPFITNKRACIIETAHPSPMSATRGFFCSDCFKRCNKYLKSQGLGEIDFQIKD